MDGTRRQVRLSGRLLAGLSVSALLALACLPVLAFADSSELEYESRIPDPTGHGSTIKDNGSNGGSATSSNAPAPDQSATGSGAPRPRTAGSGAEAPKHGSKGGGQAGGQAKAGVSSTDEAPGAGPNAVPASSDSGSSPLLPIVIAILALAAISIGVVLARQRRQRGHSVSPKVG